MSDDEFARTREAEYQEERDALIVVLRRAKNLFFGPGDLEQDRRRAEQLADAMMKMKYPGRRR